MEEQTQAAQHTVPLHFCGLVSGLSSAPFSFFFLAVFVGSSFPFPIPPLLLRFLLSLYFLGSGH